MATGNCKPSNFYKNPLKQTDSSNCPLDSYYLWSQEPESIKKHCIYSESHLTAPEYLCDLIRLNVKSTTIRTRASFDPCLLCVPPISKTYANSFFDRSFVYAAPTLWNTLDLDIRLLPFDAFKKRVMYFAN